MTRRLDLALAVTISSILVCGCGFSMAARPETQDGLDAEPVTESETPTGFEAMHVADVLNTEDGPVVVLADAGENVLLPIWIGTAEALAIALRLDGQAFERPLTHDLVDAMLRELGAELVAVRIDSMDESTFVATLELRDGDRLFLLDSRASDSIAIALSNDAPIFVSHRVIIEAAFPGDLDPAIEENPVSEPLPMMDL